jgi:hypothetical protein
MTRPGDGTGRAPEDSSAHEPDGPDSSVMGSLPRSRPTIRSPRRDSAAARGARSASASERPAEPGGDQTGLEDLARVGVSAAAGAAALGLRLAGRAASAVREALERR